MIRIGQILTEAYTSLHLSSSLPLAVRSIPIATTHAMDNPANFHEVTSTTQFQGLLSADLNRVSLLNFWAPWAEPCKEMNELVLQLAKLYGGVLVLNVCLNLLFAVGADGSKWVGLIRSRRRSKQTSPSRLTCRPYRYS